MNTYSAHLEPFRQLAREINQERSTLAVILTDVPQSQTNSVLCLDPSIDSTGIDSIQEAQGELERVAIELSPSLQQLSYQNDNNSEMPATPQPERLEEIGETEAVRQRKEGLKSAVSHDAFPMLAFLLGLIAFVWVFWKLIEVVGQGIYAGFITLYRLLKGNFSPQASNPVVVWTEWVENPVERTQLQKI